MRLAAIYLMVLTVPLSAQTTTQPSDTDALPLLTAENKLLRQQIEKQNQQIADLRERIAQLTAQVEELGLAPASDATSRPARETPVRRIVFVRVQSGSGVNDQILGAVNEMAESQYFAVLTPTRSETYRFEPNLVRATERNKQKLKEYLAPDVIFVGAWLEGVEIAARWRPDVIWLVGNIQPGEDEAQIIAEFKKRIAGSNSRVNTSVMFSGHHAPSQHLLWRIAHETGGVCLDAKGEPITEPSLPIKPVTKPAPAPPKSVLKMD